jgi:hypothetical protein
MYKLVHIKYNKKSAWSGVRYQLKNEEKKSLCRLIHEGSEDTEKNSRKQKKTTVWVEETLVDGTTPEDRTRRNYWTKNQSKNTEKTTWRELHSVGGMDDSDREQRVESCHPQSGIKYVHAVYIHAPPT